VDEYRIEKWENSFGGLGGYLGDRMKKASQIM
jgi:hypothetical protein